MTERGDVLAATLAGARDVRAGCDALFAYLRARGASRYDEAVTQLEHALQSAMAARRNRASAAEVTAALLHDIGHLAGLEAGHAPGMAGCGTPDHER